MPTTDRAFTSENGQKKETRKLGESKTCRHDSLIHSCVEDGTKLHLTRDVGERCSGESTPHSGQRDATASSDYMALKASKRPLSLKACCCHTCTSLLPVREGPLDQLSCSGNETTAMLKHVLTLCSSNDKIHTSDCVTVKIEESKSTHVLLIEPCAANECMTTTAGVSAST